MHLESSNKYEVLEERMAKCPRGIICRTIVLLGLVQTVNFQMHKEFISVSENSTVSSLLYAKKVRIDLYMTSISLKCQRSEYYMNKSENIT